MILNSLLIMAQELKLKPVRAKQVWRAIHAAAIAATGIYFVSGRFGTIIGCAGIAFFGAGMIISCWLMFPDSSYLKLGPEGFTIRHLSRIYRVRWEDVESFQVRDYGMRKMVVFKFSDSGREKNSARYLATAPGLHDGILRDTYRRSPEKLAATMDKWRARALQDAVS